MQRAERKPTRGLRAIVVVSETHVEPKGGTHVSIATSFGFARCVGDDESFLRKRFSPEWNAAAGCNHFHGCSPGRSIRILPVPHQYLFARQRQNDCAAKGNLIFTSPGLNATVTNLNDPAKQVTINITGSFHVSPTSDGGQLFVATGRNLLTDPFARVVLAIGNFSFAFDAKGNLTQPLTMQGGTLTNLCELLK